MQYFFVDRPIDNKNIPESEWAQSIQVVDYDPDKLMADTGEMRFSIDDMRAFCRFVATKLNQEYQSADKSFDLCIKSNDDIGCAYWSGVMDKCADISDWVSNEALDEFFKTR